MSDSPEKHNMFAPHTQKKHIINEDKFQRLLHTLKSKSNWILCSLCSRSIDGATITEQLHNSFDTFGCGIIKNNLQTLQRAHTHTHKSQICQMRRSLLQTELCMCFIGPKHLIDSKALRPTHHSSSVAQALLQRTRNLRSRFHKKKSVGLHTHQFVEQLLLLDLSVITGMDRSLRFFNQTFDGTLCSLKIRFKSMKSLNEEQIAKSLFVLFSGGGLELNERLCTPNTDGNNTKQSA